LCGGNAAKSVFIKGGNQKPEGNNNNNKTYKWLSVKETQNVCMCVYECANECVYTCVYVFFFVRELHAG